MTKEGTSFTPLPAVQRCAQCQLIVHWEEDKGWVHPGGRAYVMECPECNWVGEQPADRLTFQTDICPNCKVQGKLRDNHLASPGQPLHPLPVIQVRMMELRESGR
jgi:hypothetical protein